MYYTAQVSKTQHFKAYKYLLFVNASVSMHTFFQVRRIFTVQADQTSWSSGSLPVYLGTQRYSDSLSAGHCAKNREQDIGRLFNKTGHTDSVLTVEALQRQMHYCGYNIGLGRYWLILDIIYHHSNTKSWRKGKLFNAVLIKHKKQVIID